jgi:hypothetical protein
MYDPLLGRMLSPDNYVQEPYNSQSYNRYSYCLNNPLKYTDPSGELIWLIPNIGWSKSSGFSIGLTFMVGIPGVASAQASVGYSFKSNDFNANIGATAAFNTAYGSYSTQSGFSIGWSAGLSPQLGFPISTNFTSVGVNYNITHNAWNGNISAWNVDKSGVSFNPSFSAMIYPEQTTNLVRGQGFRSNSGVFNKMMKGDYACQEIIDYFGFKGTYDPNIRSKNYQAESYWGATNTKTGQISYGDLAFESYKTLKATYYKESYTHRNIKHGTVSNLPTEYQGLGMNTCLEEINGYIYAYKNEGLYRNSTFPWNGIEYYQTWLSAYEISYPTYTTNRFLNTIYRIPRLW